MKQRPEWRETVAAAPGKKPEPTEAQTRHRGLLGRAIVRRAWPARAISAGRSWKTGGLYFAIGGAGVLIFCWLVQGEIGIPVGVGYAGLACLGSGCLSFLTGYLMD